jgi:signal transduction histidine kinase/CheY-like chemotaxis protein
MFALTAPISITLLGFATVLLASTIGWLLQRARVADRRREDAERRLWRVTSSESLATALSAARGSLEVASTCLPELKQAMGASAGTAFLLSPDQSDVMLVQAIGYDEPISVRFPRSAHNPIAASIQQGELLTGPEKGASDSGLDAATFLRRHQWFAVVPLTTGTQAIGAVTLGFDGRRELDADDRRWMLEAGRQTARALERSFEYDRAERARVDSEAFRQRADAELQERRRAEAAHRESEARYRALAARSHRLYNLSAALSESVTLDAVARAVVSQSRGAVGAAAGAVALCADGETFETLYAEEYPPQVEEAWHRFAAAPGLCTTAAIETARPVLVGSFEKWQAEYPRSAATAADGGFTSAASLPLLVDNTPIGVLSFHFTVPVHFDQEYQALLASVAHHAAQAIDRARLYETTQRARVEAETANRAKDEFLSVVSHELRTPLNAILGWGAMLRDGSLDDTRASRATDAIVNNAMRQARLIEDLLEVSRIVAGRVSLDLRELALAEIVRGAVEAMLPTAAQRGVELCVEQLPLVRVIADPHRLEQVFVNLLANAVKFSQSGGRVIVDGSVNDGTARIRVVDHGCGIHADVLPHIFERFRQANSTTARSVGGLGLGLFIVRRLLEAQQGAVLAESPGVNAGSTFTVTMPIVAVSVANSARPPVGQPGSMVSGVRSQLSGLRVLLVDDEPDAREMMSSALNLGGASVTTAGSVREALSKLNAASVDIVLADLAMPDEDGYALIRRIRSHPDARIAQLPVAAVTACAREDERQRALSAGFHLHLAKPVAPGALVETVTRLAGMSAAG